MYGRPIEDNLHRSEDRWTPPQPVKAADHADN
jgi:hypothetical protein